MTTTASRPPGASAREKLVSGMYQASAILNEDVDLIHPGMQGRARFAALDRPGQGRHRLLGHRQAQTTLRYAHVDIDLGLATEPAEALRYE